MCCLFFLLLLLAPLALTFSGLDPAQHCPKVKYKSGPCVHNFQTVETIFYRMDDNEKCVRQVDVDRIPCNIKDGQCPKIRTVINRPCEGGFSPTFIMRYEWNVKTRNCDRKSYTIGVPCGPETETAKSDNSVSCPSPKYQEEPCEGEIRPVFKIFFTASEGKCLRKVEYTAEPCATFNADISCRKLEMVSRGACDGDQNQYVMKRYHERQANGQCMPKEKVTYEKCVKSEGCPNRKEIGPVGECTDGEQEMMVKDYHLNDKNECVPEKKLLHKPCGKHLTGDCTKRRLVNPGHCKSNGYFDLIIVHFHRDLQNVCQRTKSIVEKPCEELKNYHSDPKCPAATYEQEDCQAGLRKVIRHYFMKTDLCHARRELTVEPCVYTDPSQSCPTTKREAVSPCRDGQITVTQYGWETTQHGCQESITNLHHAC
ncbi:hypothetical protein Ciccas_006997 [Cichlidogyrus casuarinus]|uniref:Uncharacterized protein n=1 Tax=Cichlidogyrus casuarinus TaxID=1844966 RepID=A0ABD2Q449_9PLAT